MSEVWKWATDLFPLNRSLTGTGNLETLKYLKDIDNNLSIKYFSSGKKVFDWTVPDEWSVKSAYLIDSKGKKLCDFEVNNFNNKKYFQVLNSCLRKNIEEYSDEKLSINCNENGNINFDINDLGRIKIKLVISRKLERKDKTTYAAK